jgi:hypothetical protein
MFFFFFRASSAKEKLREESLKYLTKDRILQLIEEGFDTAKTPVNLLILVLFSEIIFFQLEKHYSKPSVVKVEEWPLFPDFEV